jgi:hypothetical protein
LPVKNEGAFFLMAIPSLTQKKIGNPPFSGKITASFVEIGVCWFDFRGPDKSVFIVKTGP